MRHDDTWLVRAVADRARPLRGASSDLDPLVELCGDARCVLIGEATHGTHEFYRLRALLTRRLIVEKGFAAVAAEADWPDAYRVNRWVQGLPGDQDAVDALAGFRRFPQWMWRNSDVLDFVGWLRSHDEGLPPEKRVGFYGLDLYSLHASMAAVLAYLHKTDPGAARRARRRYACFDQFGEEPHTYGYVAERGLTKDCEAAVVSQLVELRRRRGELVSRDGMLAHDEYFAAEQNARLVKNAEEYYRAMFRGRVASWNLRDTHMADTLDALLLHLRHRFDPARVVVWAHNSHVGDARATEMGDGGELNIGQLARERHPGGTVLIGFSTHSGTVTAASDWDEPAERLRVRSGLPGSHEELFHRTGVPAFLLDLRDLGEAAGGLHASRLQRAIGVVYRPDTERMSHYNNVRLPAQFDAMMHIDRTRALEPLERTATWGHGEPPETYPTGM